MTTAFDLQFDVWPPTSVAVRHGVAAPVGAIRISSKRKTGSTGGSKATQVRMIKVRADGPPARRWMNLARFWWIRNKGPVPADKRVAHLDGNTLNDDPKNYALFSPGDVIACQHLDNPTWSTRQHRRAAAGTARSNRERSGVARSLRWFADRWYAVDLAAQTIINEPFRKRWMVYAAHGVQIVAKSNGKGYESIVLGWPELSKMSAAVLAVLVDGPASGLEIWRRAAEILRRHGWTVPARRNSLPQYISALFARGWVSSERQSGKRRLYSITPAGREARQIAPAVVARRGSELSSAEFAHFQRVIPAQSEAA